MKTLRFIVGIGIIVVGVHLNAASKAKQSAYRIPKELFDGRVCKIECSEPNQECYSMLNTNGFRQVARKTRYELKSGNKATYEVYTVIPGRIRYIEGRTRGIKAKEIFDTFKKSCE